MTTEAKTEEQKVEEDNGSYYSNKALKYMANEFIQYAQSGDPRAAMLVGVMSATLQMPQEMVVARIQELARLEV